MNKKITTLVLLSLSGAMALTGCQSIQDQMGAKLAEGIINSSTNGEVKVNFDDLKNGKMTIKTKDGTIQTSSDGADGGALKMTDENGKTLVDASADGKNVVIKDASGKSVITADDKSLTVTDETGKTATMSGDSGDKRPADVPADLPTLDNGADFSYFSYSGTTSVTYKVVDKDFKAVCAKQIASVEGAGWTKDAEGFSIEGSDSIMKAYVKNNENLTLTCGLNDMETTIGLQKTAKAA